MPKHLRLLLAASLALSVMAAGCGQARDSAGPTARAAAAGPLTKQQFIAQADAICERMIAKSQAEAKALKARPAKALERALALQGRLIGELRGLEPPPGDKAKVRPVLVHLDRLQAAMRALGTTEGEEVLVPVAAIAVEMDAVARAAKRYGMFRRCGTYQENPGVQRILREQEEEAQALKGAEAQPSKRRTPPPPVPEIQRLASSLVPAGRSVLRRQDCAGGDPGSPSCVTIELAPTDRPVAVRRAEIVRLAARAGWTQPRPTDGRWPVGLLALRRGDYDATVWLARSDCTPQLQVGDGPNPNATTSRCVDTIMVTAFL